MDAEAAYLKAGQLFIAHAGYGSPEALIASAKWRLAVQQTRELPGGWMGDAKLAFIPGANCKSPPAGLAEAWEQRVEAAGETPDDAAICLRLVLAFYREHIGPTSPETATIVHDLAATLNQLGNTDEAEALAREGLATRSTALGTGHPDTLRSLRLLGNVLAAQGRADEASAIADQLAGKPGAIGIAALADQATLLDEQGRFAKAEPIWQQSTEKLAGASLNMPLLVRVLAGRVFNQMMLGKCDPALHQALGTMLEQKRAANPMSAMLSADGPLDESYVQGLPCAGKSAEAAKSYELIARAQMGKVAPGYSWYPPAARIEARRSLTLAGNPETVDDALAAGRQAVFIARNRRFTQEWTGNTATGKRKLPSGDTGSDPLAIAFVAKLRADWAGVMRDSPQGAPKDVYGAATAMPLSEAKPSNEITIKEAGILAYGWDGFEVAQDIGISSAARALLQAAARSGSGDPQLSKLIQQQQSLTEELQQRERTLFGRGGVDPQELASLERAKARLDALNAEVQRRYPRYAELVRPGAANVRAVQERLKPGEALLYIQPAWNDVYVFAVSKQAFTWHRVQGTAAELDEKVRQLRCVLDGSSCHLGESSNRPFDRTLAYEIYRDVVAPVEAAIGDSERLYVVASGSMGGLPLALLPTKAPAGPSVAPGAVEETQWLADRYAFVTLPSVSSLRAFDRVARPEGGVELLGFGDPVLGPPEEPEPEAVAQPQPASRGVRGSDGLANVAELRTLHSLPNSRRELMRIAASLDAPATSLLLGQAATERAVKSSKALLEARVVVFATHGLLPRDVDGLQEPGLVFTPPAKATALDDGILTASETAALSLTADWVVLSACNTAASDGAGGESLSGLARSFLYAGAQSLLVSHWQVSDEATAALTSETVRVAKLNPQIGRAKAFQAAMRAVRTGRTFDGAMLAGWKAEWADPWFWAPFVLIETSD